MPDALCSLMKLYVSTLVEHQSVQSLNVSSFFLFCNTSYHLLWDIRPVTTDQVFVHWHKLQVVIFCILYNLPLSMVSMTTTALHLVQNQHDN